MRRVKEAFWLHVSIMIDSKHIRPDSEMTYITAEHDTTYLFGGRLCRIIDHVIQ